MGKKKQGIYCVGSALFVLFFLFLFFLIPLARKKKSYFAIMPHYMIEPDIVDQEYQALAEIMEEIESVVLISPNHRQDGSFGYNTFCEQTDQLLCFKESCLTLGKTRKKRRHCGFDKATKQNDLRQKDGDTRTTKEHGIGEHIKYLKKHFPSAKLFPYVVSAYDEEGANVLGEELKKKKFPGKTLYLASIDFSHFVQEDFARIHDRTAYYTLSSESGRDDIATLEIDCQSCFFIVHELAKKKKNYPQLQRRDSVASIYKNTDPSMNTSRQFISFTKKNKAEQGLTISLRGDLIYERGVRSLLPDKKDIQKHFTFFYPPEDEKENNIHRLLKGIDISVWNMESPLVKTIDECAEKRSELSFCSTDKIIGVLKEIGFTHASIANNHSLDRGIIGYQETARLLARRGIAGFGHIIENKESILETKTHESSGSVRGISYIRLGYDLTKNTNQREHYFEEVKEKKKEFDHVFVSVHRGFEYEKKPSIAQQKRGKEFIDAGASFVYGHHPHVVQPIEWYKEKPIIYSVGNFLFDQREDKETRFGMYVLIDIEQDGDITILTGSIDNYQGLLLTE